jgi:hypothetical protein
LPVRLTVAPEITAPDVSVTVPVIPPSVCCAFAGEAPRKAKATIKVIIDVKVLICNFIDLTLQGIRLQKFQNF